MHLAFVLSPEQSRPPSTISIPAFVLSSNGPRGAKQGSSDSAHQRFAVWPFRCASSWQRRCGSPASPGRRQKQPPRPKSQRSDGPMHEVPEMDSSGFPSRYQQRCAAQTAHKPHQLRIMDKDSVEKHRRRRVEVRNGSARLLRVHDTCIGKWRHLIGPSLPNPGLTLYFHQQCFCSK